MSKSAHKRMWRAGLLAVGASAGATALASVATSGLAAYFARRVIVPELAPEDVEILHVDGFDDDMRIQLAADDDTMAPGSYGLFFDAGHGHATIGDVIEYDPVSKTVARQVLAVNSGDLRKARWGRMNGTMYPSPSALELPYENVDVHSDAGTLPTWLLPTTAAAPHDTWAILVHGRAATRAETLRAAPLLDHLGIPALAMSYRSDPEVLDGPGNRYGLGDTEWRDVDAAIDYATAHGAKRVVLFGWSMGGAICFQAAARGRNRGAVCAMVLDAPVVDWYDVLGHQAKENFLPTPVALLSLHMLTRPWARRITGLETPVNLDRLDWVRRAAELDKPVLLIHSDDDDFVPSGPSHSLARARSDLVTMPAYSGARHTREYNVDPERWNDDVARFLETVVLP